MELSGVEWSGNIRSGVEWSGDDWCTQGTGVLVRGTRVRVRTYVLFNTVGLGCLDDCPTEAELLY